MMDALRPFGVVQVYRSIIRAALRRGAYTGMRHRGSAAESDVETPQALAYTSIANAQDTRRRASPDRATRSGRRAGGRAPRRRDAVAAHQAVHADRSRRDPGD